MYSKNDSGYEQAKQIRLLKGELRTKVFIFLNSNRTPAERASFEKSLGTSQNYPIDSGVLNEFSEDFFDIIFERFFLANSVLPADFSDYRQLPFRSLSSLVAGLSDNTVQAEILSYMKSNDIPKIRSAKNLNDHAAQAQQT